MAKICFEIEVDTETGEVMAGVCPPNEEASQEDMAEDKSYLQPVGSVDDALSAAKDALAGTQSQGAQRSRNRDEIRRGYDRAKGPGPGMMGGM